MGPKRAQSAQMWPGPPSGYVRRTSAPTRPGFTRRSAPTRRGSRRTASATGGIKPRSAPTRRQAVTTRAVATRRRPRRGRSGPARRWWSRRRDTGAPTAVDERRLGLGAARAEPRAVADDLDRDVADLEAGRAHPAAVSASRATPGGAGPLPAPRCRSCEPRSPSPAADSSASQAACAATSRVGVPLEALRLVGPGEPGQVERDAVGEPVDVGADADADGAGGRAARR